MTPEHWMKRLMKTVVPESLLVAVMVCSAVPLSAQVKFDMQGDHVSVLVGGKPFTDFYTGAAYPKPFLWPLRSVEGLSVTRNFPMRIVPGESTDHPHHRGLFIGYGEINGLNFWENEESYKTSNRGRIVIRRIGDMKGGKKSGTLNALFEWHDPAGADIMDENRTMVFYDEADRRTIDFDITFTAKIALNWADTKEGFFAIRLADSMAEKNGGLMVNSEGARGEKAVWGHQAFWVDYSGKVEGQQLGVSILAHPSNPRFPPRWHSRAYGLFAVNPWGLKQFIGDEQAKGGGLTMRPGESMRLRYRVIIHGSNIVPLNVPDLFREYISKVR
jgi:methane monooxygenase PmoA-like